MFMVRVIENREVCEYDPEHEEEKKKHSEGCDVFKFAGGELYSQWPWSYRLLETIFTVLLNLVQILFSLSDSTLKWNLATYKMWVLPY